jgi:arylsulfatase A-like enzyme
LAITFDGHDQLPYITGQTDESPRQHFFYVSDDGDLTALRFDNWKLAAPSAERGHRRCPFRDVRNTSARPLSGHRIPDSARQ